jgi:ATP-binding cassette subfamily B protein
MRERGLPRLVAVFALAYAADYGLFVLSWWLLGLSVLRSPIEYGFLYLWALSLLSMLPFRILSTWSAGEIAVRAGELLKTRLLAGAMRLSPDELRAAGAGRHLARVLESEAVETLALSGGLLASAASIELLVALGIVALGARAFFEGALLAAILLLFGILARTYFEARRDWTDARLEVSHELVEKMVGHRTRLAQERPERWHEREDEALAAYEEKSRKADRLYSWIQALPRLWLPLGVLGLAASHPSPERLAVGLGAAILACRAMTKLGDGFSDFVDAAVAWERVAPLFHAAARPKALVENVVAGNGRDLLEARDVSYIYPHGARAVLEGVSFSLPRGGRVLLTSPSGGGKSTLVALMNGLRSPSGGRMLLEGRVATAPQFHENHVFTESFAFNLVMGRSWPPSGDDLREAEALCRELGLSDLLKKMPGGMNQMVGDTGWQLSHGEKSRLYLARALLQGSDLVLLDESFAALDPENLRQALLTARNRAESLLVVAHL